MPLFPNGMYCDTLSTISRGGVIINVELLCEKRKVKLMFDVFWFWVLVFCFPDPGGCSFRRARNVIGDWSLIPLISLMMSKI